MATISSSSSLPRRSLGGQPAAVPRYALAAVQNPLQHDGPDVRRQSHFRPARHDRAEIPGPPAAGRLRSVRVSIVCVCVCVSFPNLYENFVFFRQLHDMAVAATINLVMRQFLLWSPLP